MREIFSSGGTKMKAVGYIRVSSKMQAKQGHSLDMQRKMIADYVRGKGWILSDLFCETAQSGKLIDRPALQMLLTRARRHAFDVIVVTSFDRFHRNLLHLLLALDQLRQWDVSFVSITENIEFTTPWGKVALAVVGSLAEIYCDRLSLDTKHGKQGRVLKGLWNGSIPLGYCNGLCSTCTDVNGLNYCPQYGQPNRSDGTTLVLHPTESIAVRLSFDWYETRTYSDGLIAEKLNGFVVTLPDGTTRHFRTKRLLSRGGPQPFTRDSVREMLMRVFYTGRVAYFGTTTRGTKLKRHHPALLRPGTQLALISMEVFERCQEIRRQLAHRSKCALLAHRAPFPLTGILYCGECGGHMIGAHAHGHRVYRCNARLQHRTYCTQPSVNADEIEATIVQVLSHLSWSDEWREEWRQVLASAWDELPCVSEEMRREKTREEKFRQAERVGIEEQSLQTHDQVARQRSFQIDQLVEAMEPLSAFRARWEIAISMRDDQTPKQLLRTALVRVVVRGQSIEKIEASRAFGHLLQNTQVAINANPIGAEVRRLITQLLS
jgi:DNA invertase Pin-like site-specific DNA recombinase